MRSMIGQLASFYWQSTQQLNYLQPIALLAARLYVAKVFFAAGLTKLQDWDTTLFLFEEEYSVPLLPFEWAAVLGTAGEILLPFLIVVGLGARFGALGLSIVNVVAVLSLEEIAPAAMGLHVIWGLLLAQVVVWGAGALSADAWLKSNLKVNEKAGQSAYS
ncbi:DoxX family protein [Motiliproteus coralliicola]|uniref:DoxX family protein n=1 Tax=Motiliproteus coralliicola TaxID=2283196 RepID=A0A369WVQ6_9GAMM|nr:DoxX family protein [Motiliproteus coralliicola]RDE24626.1 DoxX family protein [Motiliproteus coralliicola]